MPVQQPSTPDSNSLIGQRVLEGWMLKKKRKKMQGFARRYFYLTEKPATLSYSFSPQSRIRDSVYISLSSISISRRSRSIHIDSGGSLVMHIKTLSDSDFVRWTDALKSLVSQGNLKEHERRQRRKTAKKSKGSESSGGVPSVGLGLNLAALNALRPLDMSTIYHSISRMQTPLVALESVQTSLRELLLNEHISPPTFDSPGGIPNTPTSSPNANVNKGKKPNIFRHQSHSTSTYSSSVQAPTEGARVLKIITDALSELRTEHLNLVDLLNAHSTSIKNHSGQPGQIPPMLRHSSDTSIELASASTTTPTTAISLKPSTQAPAILAPTCSATLLRPVDLPKVLRSNPSDIDEKSDSNDSESDLTYHDAPSEEGGFVDLDAIDSNNVEREEIEFDSSGTGTLESSDDSETDSSSEEDAGEEETDKNSKINDNKIHDGHYRSDSTHTVKSIAIKQKNLNSNPQQTLIERRKELPSTVTGDEFSVFAMLRKNVGKDLSQVSFPISFNEPLSALQKLCEECEYADVLLNQAVKCKDPIERLVYVSAFAVSSFSSTKTRASRKPFNPILGETYECIRPDKGFRFISEKVSHHPPIMAAYAEGDGWKLEMTSSIRQKFWGKSLEIIPEGSTRLTIFESNKGSPRSSDRIVAVYHWDKPSSFVRNLMSGTKYLEHIGKITIENDKGSEKSTIEFKPGTTFGGESSRNKIEIKISDNEGQTQAILTGKWDTMLINSETEEIIYETKPLSPNSIKYYGFTQFAIELNEITLDIKNKLPITDSRFRPDQKLLEEGKMNEAELIKLELEEKQRERRKLIVNHIPLWFEKKSEGDWVYKGGYFETREHDPPNWPCSNIF
ncbi:hypothetical protein CROQUDRAFT_661834 [Cronartium quercuum f. sp. fusiforme G11]|uniref:PH domain-containing protein n=1 Tax=Cronartium quercuum f. sp. fusiforme G11 TaxID=708437 RepID=A0A9P6T8V6_9BASI|nr:hypothetical protein CROQUDRAFT_661834 [Cronartium quercuum f. sp. fusiforme G11]